MIEKKRVIASISAGFLASASRPHVLDTNRRRRGLSETTFARVRRKLSLRSLTQRAFESIGFCSDFFLSLRSIKVSPWSSARNIPCAMLAIGLQVSPAFSESPYALPVRLMPYGQMVAAPSGAMNLCVRYSWACTHSGRNTQITQHQMNEAIRINQRVNRTVRQISDMQQYGREDVWALPTARGGDCEDIALQKKFELIAAGLPPERLLLATVLDRNRGAHAVLVLRTGQGYFVLDNLTNEVRLWERTNYTFLRIQNPDAPSTWLAVFAGGILTS